MKNEELIAKNQELRAELKKIILRYQNLEKYSKEMEQKVHDLERQKRNIIELNIERLEKEKKEILKEKEMKKRDFMLKQVEYEIKSQKELIDTYENKFKNISELKEIKSQNRLPIIIVDNFSVSDINTANKEFKINEQIVYFKNIGKSAIALRKLITLRPRFVCGNVEEDMKKELKRKGIEYLDVDVIFHDKYASVSLENFIKSQKKGIIGLFRNVKPLY